MNVIILFDKKSDIKYIESNDYDLSALEIDACAVIEHIVLGIVGVCILNPNHSNNGLIIAQTIVDLYMAALMTVWMVLQLLTMNLICTVVGDDVAMWTEVMNGYYEDLMNAL